MHVPNLQSIQQYDVLGGRNNLVGDRFFWIHKYKCVKQINLSKSGLLNLRYLMSKVDILAFQRVVHK